MYLLNCSLYLAFESEEGCRVMTQRIRDFVMSNLIGQKFSLKVVASASLVEGGKQWNCV